MCSSINRWGAGLALAALLSVVAIEVSAIEAAAASTTSSSSSTTSTPASTSSTTSSSTSTTTPAPSTTATAGTDSTVNPGSSTTVPGDESSDSSETTVDDPLNGEGPGEEPPDVDVTVPPKTDDYGGQGPYIPPPVLWSSVKAAEAKVSEAEEAHVEAVARVRSLRLRRKQLDLLRAELDESRAVTTDDLLETTERLRQRAIAGFRRLSIGADSNVGSLFVPGALADTAEADRKSYLVDSALTVDEADRGSLEALRSRLGRDQSQAVQRAQIIDGFLDDAEEAAIEAASALDQARIEYEAFKAGSEVYISGVVFPIGGDYETPIIDSFGFPRMTGTPDEHWHEGIDLFAPRGTPLVAAERGVITKIGNGRLGGLKFWLIGESGSEWYYAHLDAFVPELHDGLVVEAGQIVGYVGDTGNAVGTPPHLHLQLHPDGGRPVNPYPLLKVVSDLDAEQADP